MLITTVARHVAQCRVNRDFAGSSCGVGRARMHTGCARPGGCACTARAVPVPMPPPPHSPRRLLLCRNERIRDPISLSHSLSIFSPLTLAVSLPLVDSSFSVSLLQLEIPFKYVPLPRVNPYSGQRK